MKCLVFICPDIRENHASHPCTYFCLSQTILHAAVRCREHVNLLLIPSKLHSLMFCNYLKLLYFCCITTYTRRSSFRTPLFNSDIYAGFMCICRVCVCIFMQTTVTKLWMHIAQVQHITLLLLWCTSSNISLASRHLILVAISKITALIKPFWRITVMLNQLTSFHNTSYAYYITWAQHYATL